MIMVEDRALLDGFRRGERGVLLQIYRHYVADVTRFLTRGFTFESQGRASAFRGFSGGYEVEAAVQEIFRRAFEEKARLAYDGLRPYRPYLLRIARNAVLNDLKAKQPILFRYRQGRPVVLDAPTEAERALEETPVATRSQDQLLEAEEVARLVAEFKAGLDPREQGVFQQRFEAGLSAERAAQALGLTRSQIRTTEDKLRARFLAHMQASGYLEHYGRAGLGAAGAMAAAALLLGWGMT